MASDNNRPVRLQNKKSLCPICGLLFLVSSKESFICTERVVDMVFVMSVVELE